MIVPITSELIGQRVSIKLRKTSPKLPKLPTPKTTIVKTQTQYYVIFWLQRIPRREQPSKVNEMTILKVISFHQEVPFFAVRRSTTYATPTPKPVPDMIQTKSKTPTWTGLNISRNWEPEVIIILLVDRKFQLVPRKTDAIITLQVLNFCFHSNFTCSNENLLYFSIFLVGLRIIKTAIIKITVDMTAMMKIQELILVQSYPMQRDVNIPPNASPKIFEQKLRAITKDLCYI